jgi:hypothetical protein
LSDADCDEADAAAVAETTSTPGPGNPIPPRKLALASVLLNWPPTDVADVSAEVRSTFAVPE